jgi:hypothetical protein
MGLMPGAGLKKDAVNYRQHEKCKTCNYFYYPNSCEKIDGNISPDAVCDKWEIASKKEPMDGEGYMDEYRKKKED